jgi:hypothetical protein
LGGRFNIHDDFLGVDTWLWAIEWYGDYEHKRTKNNYAFLRMTKHSNMATQNKFELRSSGHEYAIGFIFEGMMQYVNSFKKFVGI